MVPRELTLEEGFAAVKPDVASGKVVRPAPDANSRAVRIAKPHLSGRALLSRRHVRDQGSAGPLARSDRVREKLQPKSWSP